MPRPFDRGTATPALRFAAPSGQRVEKLEDRVCLGSVLPGPSVIGATIPAVAEFDPAGAPSVEQTPAWFERSEGVVDIRYDFRDAAGHANEITAEQQALAEEALRLWCDATGGRVRFTRDVAADSSKIVTIGVGSLSAVGEASRVGGTLGVGGGGIAPGTEQAPVVTGLIWLDRAERWDNRIGNGDPAGTVDFFTVMAHEAGHVLGLSDAAAGLMAADYGGERSASSISDALAVAQPLYMPLASGNGATGVPLSPLVDVAAAQLTQGEVQATLDYASRVTPSNDAIIAIVDRSGRILGVRVEQEVLDTITDPATLVFAIDGAVAKARTAAFFSNGDPNNVDPKHAPFGTVGPLTSRVIRFISQSTVTEREVESNPNIADPNSTVRGPGFVAPIGLGAHFPPEIPNTPPVDLFGIEHTNRDSITHPGDDGVRGTADDFQLRGRFNIDPNFVAPGQELFAPESYGVASGLLPNAQSRGIATLPGGVPLFSDETGPGGLPDGIGDTLIGGIGVFFPGPDGFATHEQGFIPGIGQTEFDRTNAYKVLEAEYIALVAAGGSSIANIEVPGFKPGNHPVQRLDLPFGRIDLVGIQLQIAGPGAGNDGLEKLLTFIRKNGLEGGPSSGADQRVTAGGDLYLDGLAVPEGWLVLPHDSAVDNITAADVERIINEGIATAEITRAAIRLDAGDVSPGARTRMVMAVTDTTGEILGLYRMKDATVFSIDVAVAKARNTAYYADPNDLQEVDRIENVPRGAAATNRTFRFVAEPRFPDGVVGTQPPPYSILNDPGIDPRTGENLGAPAPASAFQSVLGYDAFNPMTNFRDPGDAGVVAGTVPVVGTTNRANQNGIVFFPGSTALYRDGQALIGGFGVSGDGVDQDDVVTFLASEDYHPDGRTVTRADQTFVRGVRLPYVKFNRNPFG